MISPQLIQSHPFFAGLNLEHVDILARSAREHVVSAGHCLFREGDQLRQFYLVLEGVVAIVIAVPHRNGAQRTLGQLSGNPTTRDVTVSTVGTGDVFGWSALVPPYVCTAGATAVTPCRVVAFEMDKLRPDIEEDCQFARVIMLRVAQVIRERLRDLQIELLADMAVPMDARSG